MNSDLPFVLFRLRLRLSREVRPANVRVERCRYCQQQVNAKEYQDGGNHLDALEQQASEDPAEWLKAKGE